MVTKPRFYKKKTCLLILYYWQETSEREDSVRSWRTAWNWRTTAVRSALELLTLSEWHTTGCEQDIQIWHRISALSLRDGSFSPPLPSSSKRGAVSALPPRYHRVLSQHPLLLFGLPPHWILRVAADRQLRHQANRVPTVGVCEAKPEERQFCQRRGRRRVRQPRRPGGERLR